MACFRCHPFEIIFEFDRSHSLSFVRDSCLVDRSSVRDSSLMGHILSQFSRGYVLMSRLMLSLFIFHCAPSWIVSWVVAQSSERWRIWLGPISCDLLAPNYPLFMAVSIDSVFTPTFWLGWEKNYFLSRSIRCFQEFFHLFVVGTDVYIHFWWFVLYYNSMSFEILFWCVVYRSYPSMVHPHGSFRESLPNQTSVGVFGFVL